MNNTSQSKKHKKNKRNTNKKKKKKKKNKGCFMMQLRTQFLKYNQNIINHILTITSHLRWTQVSWMYTIITQTTSLMTHNFYQYHWWILSEHEVNNIQTSITNLRNSQLDVWSKSYVFINITMFPYIRTVKWNVKIFKGRKAPGKRSEIVIIK